MKIVIDTEKELIIVPDSFYTNIDKQNAILEKAGAADKKIDYIQYVKDSFETAINNPMARKSDISARRK